MIYDNSKNTILEGFGVTPERLNELREFYIHGSRGDILERICNSDGLAPNEKDLLLVTVGTLLVSQHIDDAITGRQELGANG